MKERERLEGYLELFMQPAWKALVAELEEAIETLDTLGGVRTIEDLQYRRGELNRLRQLANFEQQVRLQLDELEEVEFENVLDAV